MSMELAHFPISGVIANPTREDYALEAVHLRNESQRLWHLAGKGSGESFATAALATRFEIIARRLSWAPNPARQQERAA